VAQEVLEQLAALVVPEVLLLSVVQVMLAV
jgi:hypothetical protein